MDSLKFVALDTDDLEVVSTHLQDAEVKVADVLWRPQEKRLVIGSTVSTGWRGRIDPELCRRRAALRFDRVLACKCKHVDPAGKDDGPEPPGGGVRRADTPAGVVTLMFSGGTALRLEVECLEVELVDLGPAGGRVLPEPIAMPGSVKPAAGSTLAHPAPLSAAPQARRAIEPGALPVFARPGRAMRAMPIRLDSRAPDFAQRFRAFLATKREAAADVEQAVRAIIADVVARGDDALIELTQQIRPRRPRARRPAVTRGRDRGGRTPPATAGARRAELARERIEAYHRRQMPKDDRFTDALGVELGHRWTAIEAVGLYVPGGTAAYPSSVLMNAVPAKVAGVPRIVMVVPAPDGKLKPLVLAAAKIAGVDEIYRVGGAQAVAALAYGTRDHQAGRQDRRSRQCLCGGGEAAGVRQGRHRHDRRAVRGADPRRQHRQSRLDRRRPSGAGRARRQRAVDPDHR